MTVLQMQRHLYPNSTIVLEIKDQTMFQYKVTETLENIAEKSFTSAWQKEGGLLQNLTSKVGRSLLEREAK